MIVGISKKGMSISNSRRMKIEKEIDEDQAREGKV